MMDTPDKDTISDLTKLEEILKDSSFSPDAKLLAAFGLIVQVARAVEELQETVNAMMKERNK